MQLKNERKSFREWWHAPTTRRDRATGALVGAFGGFWLGLLGRIIASDLPVELGAAAGWGAAVAGLCAACGALFPKPVKVLLYPLSVFGPSS